MQIHHHRGHLTRTLAAIERKKLTVGFIGGSITDARPLFNWPEAVAGWFADMFPDVRMVIENAALGATGSERAVFCVQRDLIDTGCDLVFVEHAVNDMNVPSEQRRRTREGVMRKLLAGEGRDVLLAYTYCQPMYDDMVAGRVPETIAEMEQLGEHYGIGSIWMGLQAFRDTQHGRMRWEEWLPDGLHPQHRGSWSYASAVIEYLQKELLGDRPAPPPRRAALPSPMDPLNWETARMLPFDAVRTTGPWVLRRWFAVPFMPQVLETAAVGAKLSFDFTGRVLDLGFDFGKTSAEFRYRIDGGEWKLSNRDRPDWCGPLGWFRMCLLMDESTPTKHTCEIEVIHGNASGCTGTNFRLGLIGIVD